MENEIQEAFEGWYMQNTSYITTPFRKKNGTYSILIMGEMWDAYVAGYQEAQRRQGDD